MLAALSKRIRSHCEIQGVVGLSLAGAWRPHAHQTSHPVRSSSFVFSTSTLPRMATMLAQSAARAARAAPVRTRRAAVMVRASVEAPETKQEATVYYTSRSGARVVGTMEQARALCDQPRFVGAPQNIPFLRTPLARAAAPHLRSKPRIGRMLALWARLACPRGRAARPAAWAHCAPRATQNRLWWFGTHFMVPRLNPAADALCRSGACALTFALAFLLTPARPAVHRRRGLRRPLQGVIRHWHARAGEQPGRFPGGCYGFQRPGTGEDQRPVVHARGGGRARR